MTVGDRIALKRKENNVTQEELARLLGVSRQSVSSWENDLTFPETEKLIALADFFGVSVDYILRGTESPKRNGMFRFENLSYTSEKQIFGMPLVSIGKDAKGFFAIGLRARGVFALGLFAFGFVSVGVLGIGLISFASFALALLSVGGFSFGLVSIGGISVGLFATGGLALGIDAIGGSAYGKFALGGMANGEYLAIGGNAVGQIALGESKAVGTLFSYVGEDFLSHVSETVTLLESIVPPIFQGFMKIFLAFLV